MAHRWTSCTGKSSWTTFATRVTGSVFLGLLAGLLLSLDGLHLVLSRLALLDIVLAFFMLLGVHCVVADRQWFRDRVARAADGPVSKWGPVWLHRPWLLAAGLWFCYRLVNVPRFADFLISVESEMAKVSWPTGDEVVRSSAVIIFLIFALSAILAAYDLFWWFVLRYVLKIG